MGDQCKAVEIIPEPCPFLPRALWAEVIRHALAATAADGGHLAVLRLAAVLQAVSRHVAAAACEVQLTLDLQAAPEEHLELLLPLLAATPLRQLLLGPRHTAAEALLRCDAVAALSAPTLRLLGATVACTDTLQRYTALQELHLHAGVLERLYPAVLHGLPGLLHLGLHGYRQMELDQLPPGVAATLQGLEVTPQPEAMRCQLAVRLPPGMHLRQLTLHASFQRILSKKAAPEVFIDARALSRQCVTAHIEAQQAIWQLSASCRGQEAEAALAAALLHPDAVWSRLELHLLEGSCVELPPTFGPAGLPPRRTTLDLQRLAEVVQRLGGGQVQVRLQRVRASTFQLWVVVLERTVAADSLRC